MCDPIIANSTYSSLAALPAGTYRLVYDNANTIEEALTEIAGGSLFGFSKVNGFSVSEMENDKTFFWGSEASFYFCFDNIYDELAIGLFSTGMSESEVAQGVRKALSTVGLSDIDDSLKFRSPWDLSGGQQQRLLAAVILTRNISTVVACNPLTYVSHDARKGIYDALAMNIHQSAGKLIVLPELFEDLSSDTWVDLKLVSDASTFVVGNVKTLCRTRVSPQDNKQNFDTYGLRVPGTKVQILDIRDAFYVYEDGRRGLLIDKMLLLGPEIYIVCGPNGGGKTSLQRLLISRNKLSPNSLLTYKGQQIKRPFKQLAVTGHVSFILQDANLHLVGGTVKDFLGPVAEQSDVVAALHLVDYLDDDLLASPFWVRKAAIFARALFEDSDLFIFDEPMDGLAYGIYGNGAAQLLIKRANEGKTILIITHNPDLARNIAGRFIWTSEGRAEVVDLVTSLSESHPLRKWLASGSQY